SAFDTGVTANKESAWYTGITIGAVAALISAARVTTHVVLERVTASGSISKPVATSCSAVMSLKPNLVLAAFMISARMEPDPQHMSMIRGASPAGKLSTQRSANNCANQLGVHSWPR